MEEPEHGSRAADKRPAPLSSHGGIDGGPAFLAAVANAGPRDAFYARMTHWAAPDAWEAKIKPMDVALRHPHLGSRFELRLPRVSFPGYDLPELLRRLHEHAAGRSVAPAPADSTTVGPS